MSRQSGPTSTSWRSTLALTKRSLVGTGGGGAPVTMERFPTLLGVMLQSSRGMSSAHTVCPHRAASQRLLRLAAISLFLRAEEGNPARVMPCPAPGEGRVHGVGVWHWGSFPASHPALH
ncbi:Tbingi protein [Trypanosoma rangeli]|uniref:Tbingi protein n=1 Tax=Trypanosoma rangeli TaxID=5698 RepID=A0A3R7JRA4_TRYRA|nr:Tbingi protein [Trypanosoma rangeli]RNE95633.1 Tbingi protein [Trypanosoma rangeli]|eukprot:RNE95633.1 Tbingi protein [Trypanosoma rangeli]